MRIKEFTMKSGDYFRLCIEDAKEEWWDVVVRTGKFADKDEMFKSGYSGSIEIEGYFDGKEITEVTATYFFDSYEDIELDITQAEIARITDYVKEYWNSLPDNAEHCLGDAEWHEMAYAN